MELTGKVEPIDIIMTSWGRPLFTLWSIASIVRNTRYPYRLTVIDNGSSKEMQEQLFTCHKLGSISRLVLLEKNYGLEYAKHLGMSFVESRLFVSTDNDILAYEYNPDWLSQLVYFIDTYPEYAAIACRPQVLVGTGNIFQNEDEVITPFSHIPGYLRIMRTDFVKETGAWKDKRPLRGHEEYWISNKLAEHGMKVGWATNVKCWHLFGDGNDWGYTGMKVEEHGHTPISSLPHDDVEEIYKRTGIKIDYGQRS